jgi:hypothetical protein
MRCHICNSTLSPAEVQWHPQHNEWDPCGHCLSVIDEIFNDSTEEEIDAEIAFLLGAESPEVAEAPEEEDTGI